MRYITPILSIIASVVAISVWIIERHVTTQSLTTYDIFPLLGLLAFTLMWAQVVGSAIRKIFGIKSKPNKHISAITSGLILSLIVLHPLTLWVALYIDGAGLPPASYITVYGVSGLAVSALILGSVSLIIFLSYELRHRFSRSPWWRYVLGAQSLALVFIFFHALILGREVGHTWFTVVWILYGITLAVALMYNHLSKRRY